MPESLKEKPKFPNPNYRPENWSRFTGKDTSTDSAHETDNVDDFNKTEKTGISVIDAANALKEKMNRIRNLLAAEQKTAKEMGQTAEEQKKLAEEMSQKAEEQRKLAEKLGKQIIIDELTGCHSPVYYEILKSNWDRQRDNNNKFALIFIDINNLKIVNDSFGHLAGDRLIQETANYLKTIFRKEDDVIRVGGDEFIIFCKNDNNTSDFKESLEEEILKRCQQAPPVQLFFADGLTHEIEMSFAYGLAVFDANEGDQKVADVQQRADKLMYEKKRKMKKEKQKTTELNLG